eukprot:scaffold4961_cov124-Skeletonema_marinoi.AAC.2
MLRITQLRKAFNAYASKERVDVARLRLIIVLDGEGIHNEEIPASLELEDGDVIVCSLQQVDAEQTTNDQPHAYFMKVYIANPRDSLKSLPVTMRMRNPRKHLFVSILRPYFDQYCASVTSYSSTLPNIFSSVPMMISSSSSPIPG